jgi:hypothetical protein
MVVAPLQEALLRAKPQAEATSVLVAWPTSDTKYQTGKSQTTDMPKQWEGVSIWTKGAAKKIRGNCLAQIQTRFRKQHHAEGIWCTRHIKMSENYRMKEGRETHPVLNFKPLVGRT